MYNLVGFCVYRRSYLPWSPVSVIPFNSKRFLHPLPADTSGTLMGRMCDFVVLEGRVYHTIRER